MSQNQLKPIIISPELLSVSNKSKKNKTLKHNVTSVKPNQLKKDLINRIKNYRSNIQPDLNTSSENTISNDKNNEQPLVKEKLPISIEKNSNSLTNSHTEDDDFVQSIDFLKSLTSKRKSSIKKTNEFPLTNDNPPYSNLKGGSLPTYREWKNKTLKKTELDNNNQFIQNTQPIDIKSDNLGKSNKAVTFKYNVGKKNKTVSVLIKNASTRKLVSREHTKLKETNLADMKNYLKRHNLLKSGSNAPSDVIKKIYEQSLLGGDIRNANKKSIIHNYLAN